MKRAPVGGGAALTICPLANPPFGATWGPDDNILFGGPDGQGIWRVPPAGGNPENIIKATPGERLFGPQLLPDRKSVLLTVAKRTMNWNQAEVVVRVLNTGVEQVLVKPGRDGRYLSTGHLVYADGANVLAAAFDPATKQLRSPAISVIEGVMQTGRSQPGPRETGALAFAVSRDGALVFAPESADPSIRRELVGRSARHRGTRSSRASRVYRAAGFPGRHERCHRRPRRRFERYCAVGLCAACAVTRDGFTRTGHVPILDG